MKATNINELIKALRCSATPKETGTICDGCPYKVLEEITDGQFLPDYTDEDGRRFWQTCDCDQMVLDAAEYLEYATSRQSDMLAKFICQIGEMAEANWCSSQVEMLERLIGATLHGVAYDEWEKEND